MKSIVLAIALAALVPSAFASDNTSSRRYGTSEALSVQDARLGEVLMVREVRLESDKRVNAGSAIGGAVGYGVSRQVKGDQRRAAQVAGTVIGGVAGTAVHNAMTGKRGLEIYVRDFSDKRGRVLVVVQEADVMVRQGDRVFLVGKGKKTRVVPVIPQALLDPTRMAPCDASVGTWDPDACPAPRLTRVGTGLETLIADGMTVQEAIEASGALAALERRIHAMDAAPPMSNPQFTPVGSTGIGGPTQAAGACGEETHTRIGCVAR